LISKQGVVPQVPNELVTYLSINSNLKTEGIFRRSASNQLIRDFKAIYNQGRSPCDQFTEPILPAGKNKRLTRISALCLNHFSKINFIIEFF
jgi:hypothetical protein